MSRPLKIALVVLLVPVSLALMVGIVFAVDRATNDGEILGDVSVHGVRISGLGEGDALAALQDLETELLETTIPVTILGQEFALSRAEIGFDVDEQAILAEAMQVGREGGLGTQLGWWFDRFGGTEPVEIDLPYTFSTEDIAAVVARWGAEQIREAPTVGDVRYEAGRVEIDYPRAGIAVDREEATRILTAAVMDESGEPIALPTVPIEPPVDPAELDAVKAKVEQYLDGPVTLYNEEYGTRLTFPPDVIAEAVRLVRDDSGDVPRYSVYLASEPILAHAGTLSSLVSTTPVDGELIIDEEENEVRLVESIPEFEPDPTTIAAAVQIAAGSEDRRATFGYRPGEEADVSTADLEAFGIKEQLAEFTTFYQCCKSRVINIQLIADAADDTWIPPGGIFDLNEIVGQRTRAKGYVAAGAIIGNEVYCCDDPINIGGGTSQFTTTLYNAVFFAGLEDIEHQPHTIYFSRYPEAREATLGFPSPNLVFRNNTENWIVVRTNHTDTSVTAEIYGDNGGLIVESRLSDRCCWSSPPTVYHANPNVARGEQVVVSNGSFGWSVTNYRDITYPDGTTTTESWDVRYRGNPKIIDVHPCDAPPGTRDRLSPTSDACKVEEPEEGDGDGGGGGGDGGGDGA